MTLNGISPSKFQILFHKTVKVRSLVTLPADLYGLRTKIRH
jgi:hypothetical protein